MPVADFHDIAPDGEVDLILQNPEQLVTHVNSIFEDIRPPSRLNFTRSHEQIAPCMAAKAQKAITDVWEPDSWVCEEEPSEEKSMREELESDTKVKEALAVSKKNTNSNANKTYVRIRVSLKHLTLASSYFERNFKSGMSESHILSSEGRLDFRMNEENPKAMLTVMNVIHGRSRQVPRRISLDMLTKIAVLVDYLECHEAIEPFSDMWIDNLKGAIATNYSKVLIQWLCISLVFHKKSQFTAMTCIAIRQAKGPVQTLGLPIRKGIVGEQTHRPNKRADTNVDFQRRSTGTGTTHSIDFSRLLKTFWKTFGKTARAARLNAMPCGMVFSQRSLAVGLFYFLARKSRSSVIALRTLLPASATYKIYDILTTLRHFVNIPAS